MTNEMGFCKLRYFMLTVCLLQIISILQRQVFDFLGYLWIPILVNFFEIIFVIFGFFGAFQYRPKYIISYSIWHLFWLGWNVFLICLYLDVGVLNHKTNKVIKLDPDSYTWWSQNVPGCRGTLNVTGTIPTYEDKNCLIDYRYVEIFQAGLQCFLSVFGIIAGLCLSKTFLEEDDSFNYMSGDGKGPQHLSLQPMYVDSASLPLNSMHTRYDGKTDSNSLISLHSNRSKAPNFPSSGTKQKQIKVYSDLIRFQNPVYRAASYDDIDSLKCNNNAHRPKSLHNDPCDAY